MSNSADRIGFLGLGLMGAGMAARVHASGFPLVVYDISEERCAPFRAKGVRRRRLAPRISRTTAEIVVSCLPSIEVSRQVSCGAGGVIEGEAVKIYVETGTIGTAAMAEIAETLVEGRHSHDRRSGQRRGSGGRTREPSPPSSPARRMRSRASDRSPRPMPAMSSSSPIIPARRRRQNSSTTCCP